MRRFLLPFLLLLLLPLSLAAQMQDGFVRTAGKPGVRGLPLGGVAIRAKGQVNAVMSDMESGQFSIMTSAKSDGDPYKISSISKSGYELLDKDFLSRQHAFSSHVPLELVMISTKEKIRIRTELEKTVRKNVERMYKVRLEQADSLLKVRRLSESEYADRLYHMQERYDALEPMISSMAEHYALTDYDRLDSLDFEINSCIVRGDLERADWLIASKGDLDERISACLRHAEENEDARRMLDTLTREVESRRMEFLKTRQNIADDLYHKYSISLSMFDNDAAAEYLRLRTELDSLNISYIDEYADFLCDYLGDYQQAYDMLLKAESRFIVDESHQRSLGECYGMLSAVAAYLGDKDMAIGYAIRGQQIFSTLPDSAYEQAVCQCNIGSALCFFGDMSNGLSELKKGVDMLSEFDDPDKLPGLADVENNLGLMYYSAGLHIEAEIMLKKALERRISIFGENHPDVAYTYNGLGALYSDRTDKSLALEYYRKALEIREKNLSPNHPSVAVMYNNIGQVYVTQAKYDEALEYLNKAMELYRNAHGSHHSSGMINVYVNLAYVYEELKNDEVAMDYYQKAIAIAESFQGRELTSMKTLYENVYFFYKRIGRKKEAEECLRKAEEIGIKLREASRQHRESVEEDSIIYAKILERSAGTHVIRSEYDQALEKLQQALNIYVSHYGKTHETVESVYVQMADICFLYMRKFDKAFEYCSKAEVIAMQLYGRSNEKYGMRVAESWKVYGWMSYSTYHWEEAVEAFSNEYAIYVQLGWLDKKCAEESSMKVSMAYRRLGNSKESLKWRKISTDCKALALGEDTLEAAEAYMDYVNYCLEIEELAECIPVMEKAYEIYVKNGFAEDPDIRELPGLINRLKELCARLN